MGATTRARQPLPSCCCYCCCLNCLHLQTLKIYLAATHPWCLDASPAIEKILTPPPRRSMTYAEVDQQHPTECHVRR